jgi:hypothetical protein
MVVRAVALSNPMPQTYTWSGGSTNSWTNSASWTPTRSSVLPDDILFINGGDTITITGVPTESIGELSVAGGTFVNFQGTGCLTVNRHLDLAAGSTLDATGLTGDIIVWGITTIDGTIKIGAGRKLTVGHDMTIKGTVDGMSSASNLELLGGNSHLFLDHAIVSIAKVCVKTGPDHVRYFEGVGTFAGVTWEIDSSSMLRLTDDVTINGGELQVLDGDFDVNGHISRLNGSVMGVGPRGNVHDGAGGGAIHAYGDCSITQGGGFNVDLRVFSGTTTAWSEALKASKDGLSKTNSLKLPKRESVQVARTIGGYYPFLGVVQVDSGAILVIPSGKILALDSNSLLRESPTAMTVGSVMVVKECRTGVNVNFAGTGVSIQALGTSPASTSVIRTTGLAPSVAGATAIKRVFNIVPTTNTGLDATLTFSYRFNEIGDATESSLHLYKSTNGSTWTDMQGTVDPGSHTVSLTGINSLATWTAASPLPTPIIAGVSPKGTAIGNNVNLTILGRNFGLGATSLSFSGGGITVNSVMVVSSTQLTANVTISPTALTTHRDLIVTNTYGSATFSDALHLLYPTPTIISVSPVAGVPGESLIATVEGAGFLPGLTSVSVGGGIAINSVSVANDHTLIVHMAISPGATAGTRNFVVSNPTPGGGTAALASSFSVNPVPTLSSMSPTSGVRDQTLAVLLSGTNFVAGTTTVDFGSGITTDSVTVVSGQQARACITISSAAATGARSASVSNSGPSGMVTLSAGFTVTNPAPAIMSVVPGIGVRGKLIDVVINGAGFLPGVTTALPVSGLTMMTETFLSATQITGSFLVARDAILGYRDLTMVNSGPGGGSTTMVNALEVQNPSPTALSIAPGTGALGQSLSVVVTGTDFISGASGVDFGAGVTVGSVSIDTTGTHLTAAITIFSGATASLRNVTVTNSGPGGGSSSLTSAFTVLNLAPTLTSLSLNGGARGQTLNVTMIGSNFATGITTASFGANITMNSLTISTPTSAIANITIAPTAIIGARSVSVTNASPGGGTAALGTVFNVANPIPTLATIAPGSGARGQTLDAIITGTGFVAGTSTLTLGTDVTVNSFTVASFTQLNANITIAFTGVAGGRDVTVTNGPPGGGAGSLASGFIVNNPVPTISNLVPSSANRGSTSSVTLTGSQFIPGVTAINFGPGIVVNSYVVKSPTEIQANITLASLTASGPRTVTVTNANPGGGTATLPAGFTVGSEAATSVEGNLGMIPDQFVLQEAYPNPFNPSTRIRYGVPEDSKVRIVIHNMLGNIVAELVNGDRTRGTYELQWHADNLPSGVYLIRMNAESAESAKRYTSSRKIILMK